MKISDLKNIFTKTIELSSFKELISDQVALYKRLHRKKGSSIPIELTEDEILFFGKKEFIFLCKLYLNEELNQYEISYIVDAILLSSHVEFENNIIEEELDFFTGLEADITLLKEDVIEIMNRVMDT